VNYTFYGYNSTSTINYTFTADGDMLMWKTTGDGFFCGQTTETFSINVSTNRSKLGPESFEVMAYGTGEPSGMNMSVWVVDAFSYTGRVFDVNGQPLQGALASMLVQSFGMDGSVTIGTLTNLTNATGHFNITGIPTLSSTKQEPFFYKLSAVQYNDTGTNMYGMYIGPTLPDIPDMMLLEMLDDPQIYLKPAMTFHIRVEGYDYSSDPTNVNETCPGPTCPGWVPEFNWTEISFGYGLGDQKLGYKVAEEMSSTSTIYYVAAPLDRNYSMMINPSSSFPVSVDFSGVTDNCNSMGVNVSQAGVAATCIIQNRTYLVNATISTAKNVTPFTGFVNMTDLDELRVMAYMLEGGNRVFESFSYPINFGNMENFPANDSYDDYYNLTSGYYSVFLPATEASSAVVLRAYARKGDSFYLDSFILNSSSQVFDVPSHNFSLKPLINGTEVLITANNVSTQWNSSVVANTTGVTFNFVNSTGGLLSNENSFIEVRRSIGSTEYMHAVDAASGTFTMSIPVGESFDKMIIYSQNNAPLSMPVDASVLDGTVNESKISCAKGVCNITLATFDPFDPDDPGKKFDVMMDMYLSNSTCDVPNPEAGCKMTSDQNKTEFSPLKAMLLGDISLRITMGNISVHYVKTDLLASGPPDAAFSQNSSGEDLNAAWKFGSQGPEIYERVLISMPYADTIIGNITVTIPILYDNDFAVSWNISTDTLDDLNDTDYSDYRGTEYEAYLNGSGVPCSPSDTMLTGLCYQDTANKVIWLRIPHFTGVGPVINGQGGTVQIIATKTNLSGPIAIGSQALFFLNVTNNGTGTAVDYSVVDLYNTTYLNYTDANLTVTEVNYSAGTVEWLINLSSGESELIIVNFTGMASGTADNMLFVYNATDGYQTNDSISQNTYDDTPPVVSGLSAVPASNDSYLTFTTDDFANATIEYNSTLMMENIINDSGGLQAHAFNLTGLVNDTLYYYNITTCNDVGYCNEIGPYNFTTTGTDTVCSGIQPPSSGDWSVTSATQCTDGEILLDGDLSISSSVSLSLINITLIFNTSVTDRTLNNSGTLFVNNSNISATDCSAVSTEAFRFFTNPSGLLKMYNTLVCHAGDGSGSANDYLGYGINIQADDSMLDNVTIKPIASVSKAGVYAYGVRNLSVLRSNIINGGVAGHGIWLFRSNYSNVSNNNVTVTGNQSYGLYMINSTGNEIGHNLFFANGGFGLEVLGDGPIWYNHTFDVENRVNNDYLVYLFANDSLSFIGASYSQLFATYSTNLSLTNMEFDHKVIMVGIENSNFSGIDIAAPDGQYHGALELRNSNNNTFSDAWLNTTSRYSNVIYLTDSHNNSFIRLNVSVGDRYSAGFYLNGSANNTVSGCNITASDTDDEGIYVTGASSSGNIFEGTEFDMSGTADYGIRLEDSGSGNIIRQNTLFMDITNGDGINLDGTSQSQVYQNTITCTGTSSNGIYLKSSSDSNLLHNNTIVVAGTSLGKGYTVSASSQNLFDNENITTTGDYSAGMYVAMASHYNNLTHMHITTYGSTYADGVQLFNSSGLGQHPENNTFMDSVISTNGSYSVYGLGGVSWAENYLINVTMNKSAVFVNGTSPTMLLVGYWLDVAVNSTNQTSVQDADVRVYKSDGTLAWNETTGSTGNTSVHATYEYRQNESGISYFTSYIINATHSVFAQNNLSLNLTQSTRAILMLLQDITPPVVSGLVVSTTNETASITFSTDDFANATIEYNTTLLLENIINNSGNLQAHVFNLTGLANNTLHYYNITVCNADGYCDEAGPYNFTTNATRSLINSNSSSIYEWRMHGRTLNNNRYYPDTVNMTDFGLMWSSTFGGATVWTSPVIVGGIVYLTTQTNLTAFDLTNGTVLYTMYVDELVENTPTIADEILFLGGWNFMAAIDVNDQSLLWNTSTADQVEGQSAVVYDGIVYFGDNSGVFYAMDVMTGVTQWSVATGTMIADSSPTYQQGALYFGNNAGVVFALNASDGTQFWNYSAGQIHSSLIVSDGVGFFESWDDVIYALNVTDGSQIWNATASGSVAWTSPALSGDVLVAPFGMKLFAFNTSDGNHLWNFSTAGNITQSSPAVTSEFVAVGSDDKQIYLVNITDGTLIWRYITDDVVRSSISIVNGTLLAKGTDKLYAFKSGYADQTAPVVVNHSVTTTNKSAEVVFYTDEASNRSILFFNDTAQFDVYGYDSFTTQLLNYSIVNLSNATTYYYNVTLCNREAVCGTTGPYNFTTNATLDLTAPVISSLSNTSTNESIYITFITDDDSNMTLDYNTTLGLGISVVNQTYKQSHVFNITDLVNTTTYYYNLTACNEQGSCQEYGSYYVATAGNVDTSAPAVSSLSNSSTSSSVTILFNTDDLANITIEYGTTTALGSTRQNATLNTGHTFVIGSLSADTLYYYNITACNVGGYCSESGPYSVRTMVSADTTAPTISSTVSSGTLTNGWYGSDIDVTLNAADTGSGINYTQYRLGTSGSWNTYSSVITLTNTTNLYYRTYDFFANSASGNKTFNIDKTPPSVYGAT
ncbi:hypothetical protein COV93_02230, partial [Candidatus Woesearchaeota archaeon CG11_big_fil_rev_8_21_14_0_20_43_8]